MHYATTDFDVEPIKITSISVKDFASGHVESFTVNEKTTEEQILKDFLSHMRKLKNYTIVTWNQKSAQYGPQQIRNRCKELGVSKSLPFSIEDVVDLDEIFGKEFGHEYIGHPKLQKLAELNNITLTGFVNGKQQIEFFHQNEYKKLENSVIRKTTTIYRFLTLSFENNLKTKGKKKKKSKQLSENIQFYIIIAVMASGIILSPFLGYYIPLMLESEQDKIEYVDVTNSTELLSKLYESKINDIEQRVTELENSLGQVTDENERRKLEQIIERLKIANTYMREQNYSDAEKFYRLVLVDHSNNTEALDGIALALARQDKFQESIDYYDKLLIIKPNYYVAVLNSAWSLAQLEQYEKSLKLLNDLESNNSDDLLVLSHLCWVLHKLDYHEDAVEYCKKVISHGTNDERVAKAYSLSLSLLNQFEEALPFHKQLYEMYPGDIPTVINYANTLLGAGKINDALNIYEKGLEKYPDNKILLHNKKVLCIKNPQLQCGVF